MSNKDEQLPGPDPKAEMRRRLVGPSLERAAEDIEFWRSASERVRGETLYELLARGEAIRASIPRTRQEEMRLILRPGKIEILPRE